MITYSSAHTHITVKRESKVKGDVGDKTETLLRKMFNDYIDVFIDIKTIVEIL
jgi:hypothetical protein